MKFKFSLSQTETNSDFVTIYDGSNDQSPQIAKLSGNLGSFSESSTGNFLFVKFESDMFGNYVGFHATIHYGNQYLNIKYVVLKTMYSKSEINLLILFF